MINGSIQPLWAQLRYKPWQVWSNNMIKHSLQGKRWLFHAVMSLLKFTSITKKGFTLLDVVVKRSLVNDEITYDFSDKGHSVTLHAVAVTSHG